MKKSLVTKITKFDKKEGYDNVSYSIEFANADKGFYSTKDENQTKFIAGKESEYNIEEKEGKNGKKYFKISVPSEYKAGGRPQLEPRIQMISFAMSYTKDLVVAGKVSIEDMDFKFNEIYALMLSKL